MKEPYRSPALIKLPLAEELPAFPRTLHLRCPHPTNQCPSCGVAVSGPEFKGSHVEWSCSNCGAITKTRTWVGSREHWRLRDERRTTWRKFVDWFWSIG